MKLKQASLLDKIFKVKILLLSEGAGGKHFSDEVEVSPVDINPRSVESYDGVMMEVLEEMNLRVKPL